MYPSFASPCHLHVARLPGVKGLRSWDRMGRTEFAMGKAEQKVWVHLLQLVCNPGGNEEPCNVQHWCYSKLPVMDRFCAISKHFQKHQSNCITRAEQPRACFMGVGLSTTSTPELKPTPYLMLNKDKGTSIQAVIMLTLLFKQRGIPGNSLMSNYRDAVPERLSNRAGSRPINTSCTSTLGLLQVFMALIRTFWLQAPAYVQKIKLTVLQHTADKGAF